MNPVILCVATTPRFQEGMKRLEESCKKHWKGDTMFFTDWPTPKGIVSYTQEQMPYQFKVAAIQQAIEAGYKQIIWLDSTMQLLTNIIYLLNYSGTGLVFFENLGHPLKNYISDAAAELLNVSDPELECIPQIWGGAFMINLNKVTANEFFRQLSICSLDGSFKDGGSKREGFIAHRHDQAVMSVLSYGICTLLPYGYIVSKQHLESGEYGTENYMLYG